MLVIVTDNKCNIKLIIQFPSLNVAKYHLTDLATSHCRRLSIVPC